MTTCKRKELPELLKNVVAGKVSPVYLLHGERYLCRQAADDLIESLLPDENRRTGNLILVDGDHEDPSQTLHQLRTYNLFGGRRVFRVSGSRILYSKVVAKTLWEKAVQHHEKNDLRAAARYLRQVLDIGGITVVDLAELSPAAWKASFGFTRPEGKFNWVADVLEKAEGPNTESSPAPGKDIAALYMAAFDEGLPADNILVLLAEAVDKRKKLYKSIAEHGTVVDLSVDTGTSKAATDSQKEVLQEIVRKTLASYGKKMDQRTMDILLERVGFHPVAAALESEKLALFTEERSSIIPADLNEIIGRTREEAVFELSEAFSNRDLKTSLTISSRLIDSGMHPLVIVAALRNHIRKMLTIRSMQDLDNPTYSPGVSFPAFKGGYLDRLKTIREADWPGDLPGHPYALYMLFRKAENFSSAYLTGALPELLKAEYSIKSSGIPNKIIIDNMFFNLLADQGPKLSTRS